MRIVTPILWALRRIGFGAAGSDYYQGADGIEVERPIGDEGQVSTVVGGVKVWADLGSVGGHYEPMIDNSDPTDPSPIYLGDGDILMLWTED